MKADFQTLLDGYRRVSIVGMCKNAGKTTALGRMIGAGGGVRLGLSSIGRDGESVDLVTGTEKPSIHVPAGTVFATAERLVPLCSVSRTVLELSDFSTPLGRVALLRADSAGLVQLAGPSTVEQMQAVSKSLFAHGAERVFIDGAIFRRSIANPALSDAVVLAAGAAAHPDMARVVAEAGYLCDLMRLPLYDGAPGARMLDGALTDAAARRLSAEGPACVVLADPSRALLSEASFAALLRRGVRLTVRARPALLFVTANPFSPYGAGFDAAAFQEALRRRVGVPVLDAKEVS
ncbi:MAG: hypothetical protein Q4C13_00930 [Clostridia bacterium]|nr:hypothetical protein [Clostridia bacterium]